MREPFNPTAADVGRAVLYRDHNWPDAEPERGVITSIGTAFVFVRFGTAGSGIACRREDLEFEGGVDG